MKIAPANSDHLVDANQTIAMPKSAGKEDHFVGINQMVGGAFQSQRDSRMAARRARDREQTIAGNVAEILEA